MKAIRALTFVLAIVLLAPLASAQIESSAISCVRIAENAGNIHRIPFRLAPNGRLFLEVEVNGEGPFRFIYDSGADGVGRADTRLVESLDLELAGMTEHTDGVNSSEIRVVRLESLAVSGVTRTDVELLSRSYNRPGARYTFDGIIGNEFFGPGVLVINYPEREFVYLPDARLDSTDDSAVAYETAYEVPIQIGALKLTANIDTGSTLSMHLPREVYDQLNAGPLEKSGKGRRANTTFDLYRATLNDTVQVGSARTGGVVARVSDLARRVNIGTGLLRDMVVAIDRDSGLLAVCQP